MPSRYSYDGPASPVARLEDAQGTALDDEAHQGCPGHAVAVEMRWVAVDAETGETVTDQDRPTTRAYRPCALAVCTDWRAHGHAARYGHDSGSKKRADQMSEDEREAAKKARALVIRCNKEWASAEAVRIEWVRTLLTRKTAPKDAAAFIATVLGAHSRIVNHYLAHRTAANLLGLPEPTYDTPHPVAHSAQKATPARALVIALGILLGACEANTEREHWRTTNRTTAYYLTALASWGYGLSEVEARANGSWIEPETEPEAERE